MPFNSVPFPSFPRFPDWIWWIPDWLWELILKILGVFKESYICKIFNYEEILLHKIIEYVGRSISGCIRGLRFKYFDYYDLNFEYLDPIKDADVIRVWQYISFFILALLLLFCLIFILFYLLFLLYLLKQIYFLFFRNYYNCLLLIQISPTYLQFLILCMIDNFKNFIYYLKSFFNI
jgi:hypothetical protein